MKANYRLVLTPVALAVATAFALYGCGSSGSGDAPAVAADTATVVAPVVNTPLDGVTVTLTCSDGKAGGSSAASQGSVSISVPTTCLAPYTMVVSGKGTMAGPDLKFGTSDDETYDSTTRTALKSVVQATDLGLAAGAALTKGASLTAPSITSLTSMVAENLGKANPSAAEIATAMTKVASVTGLAAADLYKNPMSNGDVFKAATLVNEMVASAMKADPTKKPADLVKAMAASPTAKLTDSTIDPVAMMGMSAANGAIMQAQMATMQAKAGAMKSVADAVAANVASASQAGLVPADAAKALAAAMAGTQGSDIQTAIAKAQMAQDTQKQMFEQMDKIAKDTTSTGLSASDLAAKMTAMAQGLDAVRVQQESGIQTAIKAAGTDQTAIANAMKQASSMIVGAAPALLTSVTGAKAAELTSVYMNAAASSIAAQFDPVKMAAAVATAGGDPTKINFTSMGLDPAKLATAAATSATAVSGLKLTPPTALASYPALAAQVVGMVIARATNKNYLTSTKLQDWVNAVGTAIAANDAKLLNPDTVGFTIGEYFGTKQPDLTIAPGALTLTIGAAPTFTQATTPITTAPPTGTTATPPAGTTSGGSTPTGGQSATDAAAAKAAADAAAAKTAADAAAAKTAADAAAAKTAADAAAAKTAADAAAAQQQAAAAQGINGFNLYAANCAGCHSASKKGKSVTATANAIAGNVGGMGSTALKALTQAELAAIAAAP